MQSHNSTINQPKNRGLIHIIYACLILLVIVFIFGYKMWEKRQIKNCMLHAAAEYTMEWADTCNKIAENKQNQIENCITEQSSKLYPHIFSKQETAAFCKTIYGIPDFNADCMLPAVTAQGIENRLHANEESCNK